MGNQDVLFKIDIADSFANDAKIVIAEGDSLETLRSVPDDLFQLIITSPPYNIGKEYEKATGLENYLENITPIIKELVRVLAPDGSICWQVGNYIRNSEIFPLDVHYYPIFKGLGLKLRNRVIWHFGHGLHAKKRFSGRYETLLWFTKTDDYIFNLDSVRIPAKYPGKRHYKGPNYGKLSGNPLGKNPSDVWEILLKEWETSLWEIPNVKANHPEKTLHPCQFPIELVERCILALTNEEGWILDPFSGVGSALLAAVRHNRKAMGCEKKNQYIDISKQRFADFFAGKLPYRLLGKPIYKPTDRDKISQVPEEWEIEEVNL